MDRPADPALCPFCRAPLQAAAASVGVLVCNRCGAQFTPPPESIAAPDQTLAERPDLPKESLLDQGTTPLPAPDEAFLSHASVTEDTGRPPYQPVAKDEVELRGDTILGDYRIIRKLGQGGMAVVYLARHLHLDREVAIKVLPGAFLRSKEAIDRLLREARIGAQLRHPNLCQILDARLQDGEFYLVMEYVAGPNLSELCRNAQLPLAQACHLARQLFSALQFLAAANVVHRDIKPGNLIVTAQQQIKLLDMGLAKGLADAEASGLTQAGQLIGTPAYMAPEQVVNSRDVSPAIDLYSAGMTLYAMVTGKIPYISGHIHEILLHVLNTPPTDPRQYRPELPAPLAELILRLLAKRPEDRPTHQTVMEVLEPYAADYAVSPSTPPPGQSAVGFRAAVVEQTLFPTAGVLNAIQSAARQFKQHDDELLALLPRVGGEARLGEFIVRKRIGRRSGINTFLGEMPLGKVACIIRVLPPAFGQSASQLETLLEEHGRLMRVSMRSSHLTTLLYIGKATLQQGAFRELYYTVENFVEGTTFQNMIESGARLGLSEARRCLLHAAGGLSTLHENQILHGNLHPGKFLYDPELRELRICDVTRAHIVADHSGEISASSGQELPANPSGIFLTQTHQGIAWRHWFSDCSTLRRQYIAPEILTEDARPSLASEQYALGVIFIEALTGGCVRTDDQLHKLINRVRADLEDRLDDVAEEAPRFAQIIRKLVKPNASSRYPDLRELRALLQAYHPADDQPVRARRARPRRRLESQPREKTSSAGRSRKSGKYDVFISYRREGGAETSRAIKERLEREKLSVFLDVDRLKSGQFDVALLRHIENTQNFLVILSKESLARCHEPNDWLRREIAHALRCRRRIIPLLAPGFEMPPAEQLPYELRQLVKQNGLRYQHEQFDGVMEQLLDFLRSELR